MMAGMLAKLPARGGKTSDFVHFPLVSRPSVRVIVFVRQTFIR